MSGSSSNLKIESLALRQLISGSIAGSMGSIFTCPLDVIKTRQQVQGLICTSRIKKDIYVKRPYKSLIHATKVIWAEEGIRGFYRGLGPSLFALIPNWGLYFTVYNQSKSMLTKGGKEGPFVHILSALFAAIFTDFGTMIVS
eukprot:TRINITY_DN1568_c0_g1_i1.p1 TRINITY_DN1568_c0_g1~~TRINITY_DN1568_c0_g1_i1.p1  ORF type:complete len:167 (+),score=26.31 TRINITY_DN1568_c0_g1_i1:77-502(+)